MDELLPALDVRMPEGRELASALRAALAGHVAHLRLDVAPIEQTTHALELHVEGWTEPLVLLAEPVGFSREGRFPLRLRTFDEAQRAIVSKLLVSCDSLPPAGPTADPFEGRVIAGGKYRMDRLLGAGAVGRVYKGVHTGLSRAVAVKVLHPFFANSADFTARFHDEALAASRLDHANVTRVLDFGQEDDGTLYLVMEYLEGNTLQAILDRDGPFEVGRAIRLMVQVCGALSLAHDSAIVHRDVKPENIVVVSGRSDDGSPAEIVKVCDFGIAQLQDEGRPGAAGQICGSPSYMSPEQARGEFLGPSSDVYSCGVSLFQLLTGRVPFEADDVRLLLAKHATEAAPRPSELRAEVGTRVDRVVLKCLSKEREDRFPSARELRAALIAIADPARSEEPAELQEFVSLADPRSGFARFVELLSLLLLEPGKTTPRTLAESATTMLRYCGELCLARPAEGQKFVVVTGAGEVHRIEDLFPAGPLPAHVVRLEARFIQARVVALTVRSGVDEASLAALFQLLPGKHARPLRPITVVSVLQETEILGRGRKLPWNVELLLSKVAHDIQVVWNATSIENVGKREWRARILRDALRSIDKNTDFLLALQHGDLVETAVSGGLEGSFADRALEVTPLSRVVAVTDLLVGERHSKLGRSATLSLGRRLAQEQTNDVETVLRDLKAKGLIDWSDLPDDARDWLRGSEEAPTLAKDPFGVCERLRGVDDAAFLSTMGWMRYALPLVVRRGNAVAGRAVFTYLNKHRRDPMSDDRKARIAAVLGIFERPDVLRALAEALLFGDSTQREPARLLLTGIDGAAESIVRVASSFKPTKVSMPAVRPALPRRG